MTVKFRILGSGEWGLAIANHLAQQSYSVEIFGRTRSKIDTLEQRREYKPLNIKFNENTSFHYLNDISDKAFSKDTHNIIATSSSGFADLINENKVYLSKYSDFIWLTKGLDKKSNKFFDELLTESFGKSINCCLISGPSFAKDLVSGKKINVSIASNNNKYIDTVEKYFATNNFIMHKTSDLIGVQVSGVMKNIAAILSGILTSYNYTSTDILNIVEVTKKEIFSITKYIYSVRNLTLNDDVIRETLASPSCDGDLKLSCLSNQSRNRRFGLKITKPGSFDEVIKDIGTVEGYVMTPVLHEMVRGVNVGPVLKSVYEILYGNLKLEKTEIFNYL